MKTIGTIIIALCLSIASFAQEESEENFEHHCNFEESSLTLGVGAPYSNEINSLGFNLRMYYNLDEHICFGPEYSYFKNEEYEIVDFDLIGHYIFETKIVGIYPFTGVNYTVETDLIDEEIEEFFGAIFGIGIHRNFKGLTIFAEYSRVQFGIDDQFFTGGLLISIR